MLKLLVLLVCARIFLVGVECVQRALLSTKKDTTFDLGFAIIAAVLASGVAVAGAIWVEKLANVPLFPLPLQPPTLSQPSP